MEKQRKRRVSETSGQVVQLEVPIGSEPDDGFERQEAQSGRVKVSEIGVHVEAQLGKDAAMAFLRIRNGLRAADRKLANGRPVFSNADALRYMMELAAAQIT